MAAAWDWRAQQMISTPSPSGDLVLSTKGTNANPGSDNEDINRFSGTYNPTAGTVTIELDLSSLGIPATASVDGLHHG